MNPHLRTFKNIAAQVASRHALKLSHLIRAHGLGDFLDDEVLETDSPEEIAAKALRFFCVDEGHFNGFLAGVDIVVQFLQERCRRLPYEQLCQCLKDLRSILATNASEFEIKHWIDAQFR